MFRNTKRRLMSGLLILALVLTVVSIIPAVGDRSVYASSTSVKSGTVYTEVIKHGDTAYCMVYDIMLNYKLYKVDLKNNKAKVLKKGIYLPTGMKYKNGYLYFAESTSEGYDRGG